MNSAQPNAQGLHCPSSLRRGAGAQAYSHGLPIVHRFDSPRCQLAGQDGYTPGPPLSGAFYSGDEGVDPPLTVTSGAVSPETRSPIPPLCERITVRSHGGGRSDTFRCDASPDPISGAARADAIAAASSPIQGGALC